jgi:hypothetical protein
MPSRTAQAGLQTTGGAATSTYANSVAGGMIGYASTTTAQGVGAAETTLTGLSIAVTVNANRKIRIEGYVPIGGYGTGTVGERSYVRIKENVTEFTGAAVSEQVQNGSFIAGVARPCAISGLGNMPAPWSPVTTRSTSAWKGSPRRMRRSLRPPLPPPPAQPGSRSGMTGPTSRQGRYT